MVLVPGRASWRRHSRHRVVHALGPPSWSRALGGGTRRARIIALAVAFVAGYLLVFDRLQDADVIVADADGRYSNIANLPLADSSTTAEPPKARVFYNLFVNSTEDGERVRAIVDEQFGHMKPDLHDANVLVTSIGRDLPGLPAGAFIREHRDEGGEELTLRALWEYCKANDRPQVKVVYLHSKGSFHPTNDNTHMRRFMTRGALSSDCADLPEECNVCSSRMSPLPHPHTPGNMWLARCDYISRLFDPLALQLGKLPEAMNEWNPCKGRGRFLGEHWVHSHPSVRPCDLYPGEKYAWAYRGVPRGDWEMELRTAPRFKFENYVIPGWCKSKRPETLNMQKFVELRKENYKVLYNITELDEAWWGWEFLKRSKDRR